MNKEELLNKIINYNYTNFGNEFGNCLVDMKNENQELKDKIKKVKWKPIKEYDKSKYDWVLIKYFDKDYECVPCVAEKRFDKWYDRNNEIIKFDVKYFFDMQFLDILDKGDKE